MTPVKKDLEEIEGGENISKQPEKDKNNLEQQITQLEATFTLDKVIILSFD